MRRRKMGMAEETLKNKVLDLIETSIGIGVHGELPEDLKQKTAERTIEIIKSVRIGTPEEDYFALLAFIAISVYTIFEQQVEIEVLKKKQ